MTGASAHHRHIGWFKIVKIWPKPAAEQRQSQRQDNTSLPVKTYAGYASHDEYYNRFLMKKCHVLDFF
jgi:hypothetical protein